MKPADLLEIAADGTPADGAGAPSVETALHVVIYRERPGIHAIAHVHTVWNTLLSSHCAPEGSVALHGYELLKALSGVTSHWHCERIPVVANSQNYVDLAQQLRRALAQNPHTHGVLLSAHGLFTWGTSVAEARRHLEALEFLFEVEGRRLMGARM